MKTNESYYPVTLTNTINLGISLRDKLAHDYLCNLLLINKPIGNFGLPENYDDLVESAFTLADLFIKTSNTKK